MGRSVASAARTVHRDGPYPTRETYAGSPPSTHWPLLRNASSAGDLAIAIDVKQTCRRDTQKQAIDSYLMLQPELEKLPELAGSLASELFESIDKKFPHWVYSGALRQEIVVSTNHLRRCRPGQALERSDIYIRITELRDR